MLVRPVKVTVKCMERMYADEWAFLGTSRSVRTLISHGRIALDSKRFVLQHVQWRLVKCGPGKTKFELENILDSRVHFLSHITDGDLRDQEIEGLGSRIIDKKIGWSRIFSLSDQRMRGRGDRQMSWIIEQYWRWQLPECTKKWAILTEIWVNTDRHARRKGNEMNFF